MRRPFLFIQQPILLGVLVSFLANNVFGVCAKVGLSLDQSGVVTRSAFRATLQLENGTRGTPLDAVMIAIEVKDAAGTNVNSQFLLERTSVTGADDLGINAFRVNPNSTGVFRWLLVPSDEVASNGPRECFVGGTFSYSQGTNRLVIPLEPIRITVYPDAKLKILYFYERDIFSDDPTTPMVEPAVPYSLVALVSNEGAGAARNLQLTSPGAKGYFQRKSPSD